MIVRFRFAAVFVLVFCSSSAFTQQKGLFKRLNLDSITNRNLRFLPLPSVTVTPETGLKAGVFVDYFYKTKERPGTTVRPSLSWVQALYSTRNQFTAEAFTSTYTSDEQYYIFFRGGFISNYERFWGLTRGTAANDEYAEVTYNRLYATARVQKQLGNKLFGGINLYASDYARVNFADPVPARATPPPGNNHSTILGAGVSVTVDRRDNQFSPSKGFFADISATANLDAQANRYAYTLITVDLRRYVETGRHIIASQLFSSMATAEMPLFEKIRLGGSSLMRGLFQGRFRDNGAWVLQSEYRYRLNRFLKLAVFAGAGTTTGSINDAFSQQVQTSGGAGLRVLLNKEKKIYIRGDVAVSSNGMLGYYFRIGDAF